MARLSTKGEVDFLAKQLITSLTGFQVRTVVIIVFIFGLYNDVGHSLLRYGTKGC